MPEHFGGVPAAAGYKDISGVLNSVQYTNEVVMQVYRKSTIGSWTNRRAFRGNLEYGATVQYDIESKVTMHEYQRNQRLDIDNIDLDKGQLRIGHAYYFNMKIDSLDWNKREVQNFLSKLQNNATKSLMEKMDPLAINTAMSSIPAFNRGGAAGRNGNVNLGTKAAPAQWTPTTIITEMIRAASVMKNGPDGSMWEPGNMFMLLPSDAEATLMQTELGALCCANTNRESMVLGGKLPNLAGFDIIFYDAPMEEIDNNKNTYPVLFGHKDGVAFTQRTLDFDWDLKSVEHAGRYVRGMHIAGAGVVDGRLLGLALVNLEF